MTRSDKPLPNCDALSGTVSRGVCSERLRASQKPRSVANSPGGPQRGAVSSPGSCRRGPDQPVFEESSTIKCGAGQEPQPRLVQNRKSNRKPLLPPELKQFIDRVIVPILVKEYLVAETSSRKGHQA
jgi:hypothetical protein